MEEKFNYVGWEEVYVSREKGKREIHYVLKRKDGGSDLGVIAKEKSFGHITYRFLIDFNNTSSFKPKSRRDLIFWLNSFAPAPGTDSVIPVSPQMSCGSADGNDTDVLDIETMKASQLWKLGHYTKEFTWLGSQWMCKKKRKHYQAFRHNGIKISVNQFVHVLAEENKRLVAYLDDMYEDVKGNKMVVVRWFHKIDEIGIDLPQNYNDREIFFSLCLQDLSVECIDGLATVLSSEHYMKFVSEAEHTLLQPYVCCQQYDNEDVKPLDITRVKGYWKQDVVKNMFYNASGRVLVNTELPGDAWKNEDANDVGENKPRKMLRLSRERKVDVQCASVRGAMETCQTNVALAQGSGSLYKRNSTDPLVYHRVGSSVEVLSQDSGMRGCWFRATIIKKHKNKVKIRYLDIKDAEKEADYLEEWVLASRIAASDDMSLRLNGRTVVRPSVLRPGKVSWAFNVGTVVDAWWHDGWWEGIVIRKESKDQFQVYFPGEKRQASFNQSDLRHSQEWLGGSWRKLSERVDIAVSILSAIVKKSEGRCKQLQALVSNDCHLNGGLGKSDSFGTRNCSSYLHRNTAHVKANSSAFVDLSKDDFLSQLKWESSHKRKRSGFVVRKLQQHRSYGINFNSTESQENDREFVIPTALKMGEEPRKSVKVDRDNCKYITDSLFTPSVVPSLSNLVMSR